MGVEPHLAVHAAAQFVGDILSLPAPDPAFHYRRHGQFLLRCVQSTRDRLTYGDGSGNLRDLPPVAG